MNSNFRLNVLLNHLGKNKFNHVNLQRTAGSNYEYTQEDTIFTYEMREFYERNGYIIIPKLIEDSLIDTFREHFINICEGKADLGGIVLLKDKSLMSMGAKGEHLINKIQQLSYDPIFEKYILHAKLLDVVQSIIGPNVVAMHTMLINKPPDSGKQTSIHPLHQDLYYLPFRPANRIVASWTAMETITEDNGCLYAIPGSHKGILQVHSYPDMDVNHGFHGIRGYDDYPRVNLRMEKGDTIFFHPLLIHGSGVNKSKNFRKAISCHFAASECHYIDVRGTLQELIANEVLNLVKKKYGLQIQFEDYYKMNARLVRGREITLI